jgi:ribosomal protein S18 acetylase RimI-like enzyme
MDTNILTLNHPEKDIIYVDEIMSLVERTKKANAAPYLYSNERDFFERNLAGETINVLAFDGPNIIGYSALRRMSSWPNYIEPCEHNPEQCALMLINLVDPSYRGKGIGKQLSAARIASAIKSGIYYLYVTVHPDNTPSISILKSFGFVLIAQKHMFSNNLMRNLMYLNLSS